MTDASLVRVLGRQAKGAVRLVDYAVVEAGAGAIGRRLAVVDALCDGHLRDIGKACAGHALVTGGSGVALGLPVNFVGVRSEEEKLQAVELPKAGGWAVVLAGSYAQATLGQMSIFGDRCFALIRRRWRQVKKW